MFRPKRTPRSASKGAEKRPTKGPSIGVQADRAFKKAARAAVAENDALGIATHGAKRGKMTVRIPAAKRKSQLS